uniref:Uncharacterized protein n=1 Tax=Triticum urartu TaxID=4572 RepID=A0A8R7TDF6_TRIUA
MPPPWASSPCSSFVLRACDWSGMSAPNRRKPRRLSCSLPTRQYEKREAARPRSESCRMKEVGCLFRLMTPAQTSWLMKLCVLCAQPNTRPSTLLMGLPGPLPSKTKLSVLRRPFALEPSYWNLTSKVHRPRPWPARLYGAVQRGSVDAMKW